MLTNNHTQEAILIKQEPEIAKIQVDMMNMNGFRAVKRDGSWVLWELEKWPEVMVWLQNFQTDFSQQYILMLVFKSGVLNGRTFQANEQRLSLGFPSMTSEDVERLSSFVSPWVQVDHHPS